MYTLGFNRIKKTTSLVAVSLVAAAVMMAACLLALVVKVEPSQAAFPGKNGKIAFESFRDGDWDIYTVNPDGSNQTNITNNTAPDLEPAWSPDGTKITFVTDRDGNLGDGRREIFTMNADGSNQTNITANSALSVLATNVSAPAWSPDGTKIVFSAISTQDDGFFEIFTISADGSNLIRLTNNESLDTDPAWSPDGTKIAFASDREGSNEIFTMNADGSNLTRLTNNGAWDGSPAWSPDGSKIAFTSHLLLVAGLGIEIYTMNADGSNQTNISKTASHDEDASWQPLPAPSGPKSKADCKKGGYKEFGFKNQGQCMASIQRAANNSQ
jgi:Tol biopolymer transport system component